jgi:hypothetical protein
MSTTTEESPAQAARAHQPMSEQGLARHLGYEPGRLEETYPGMTVVNDAWRRELQSWASDGKPIVITEHGADTLTGNHSLIPQA